MAAQLKIVKVYHSSNTFTVIIRNDGDAPLRPGTLEYKRYYGSNHVKESRAYNDTTLEPGEKTSLDVRRDAANEVLLRTYESTSDPKQCFPINKKIKRRWFRLRCTLE